MTRLLEPEPLAPVPPAGARTARAAGRRGAGRGGRYREADERSNVSTADLRSPRRRGAYVLAVAGTIAFLLLVGAGPLLWLAKASLSSASDLLRDPVALWPSGVRWGNLPEAWDRVKIGRYTGNTVLIAAGSVVGTLVVSVTGAFVLGVLRPAYAKVLDAAVMATLFIPGVISLVPLYLTVLDVPFLGVNLVNTYWAVWLPAAATAFNVLVLKQAFAAMPRELFDAAQMDGAGPFRVLWSIALPMARPVLGVVALLSFTTSWKDFLWPLLALPSAEKQPLSVALANIADLADQGVVMAGMFLTVVVPMVLFLVFQKQFLRGAGAAGAVKG